MKSAPNILLIDDDRLVLATMAKGLRDAGYNVHTAESGKHALELASRESFLLAIVDIRMPGLSGIETAQQLLKHYSIPSLFLSAYGDEEAVSEAVSSGGLGYVVKPVDAPQLIPAIEAAMARSRDMNALLGAKDNLEKALAGGRYTSTAVGILMERGRLSRQEAFERLRRQARSSNRKLEDLCQEVVQSLEIVNTACF
jgi:AmiR/NasT family two-component response regulator